MALVFETVIDNKRAQAGLKQFESMYDATLRKLQASGRMTGGFGGLNATLSRLDGGRIGTLNQATGQFEKIFGISNKLNQSLDKTTSLFNAGLGIGGALGAIGLLTGAFTKAIEKAQKFQTAHLAIAATLASSYNVVDQKGRPVEGAEAFQYTKGLAQKFNQEIIKRQAKNILVYEEQLGAFQSSVAAGARKGLTANQVLDVSEQAAVVAKTLGLRGEEIANASRLLMGGGVNVGRSTIGRALGVSNADITGKKGDELVDFLQGKMRGFKSAEPDFAKSIEGIISTLESKFDMLFAKVGKRFMANIAPALESFGDALEGSDGERFADSLAALFTNTAKAMETIAKSPAVPILMKFMEFIANNIDKMIGMVVGAKLAQFVASTVGAVKILSQSLRDLTVGASGVAMSMEKASGSVAKFGVASAATAAVSGAAGAVGGMAGGGASTLAEAEALAAGAFGGLGGFAKPGGIGKMALTAAQQKALQNTRMRGRAGLMGTFLGQNVAGDLKGNFAAWQAQQLQMNALAGAAGAYGMSGAAGGLGTRMMGGLGKMGAYGKMLLPKMLDGLLYGSMASMGINALSSSKGWDKSELGGALTSALSSAAMTALTLKPLLQIPGGAIPYAALVAGSAAYSGVNSSMNYNRKLEDDSRSSLRDTDQNAPEGAKLVAMRKRMADLNRTLVTGKRANVDDQGISNADPGFWLPIWSDITGKGIGETGGLADANIGSKGKKALQKEREDLKKKLNDFKERGKLSLASPERAAEENLIEADKRLEIANLGYGNDYEKMQLGFEKQRAEIAKMAEEGKLTDDQERKLLNDAKIRFGDQLQGYALNREAGKAALDLSPVSGAKRRGLLGIEQEYLGKKETLGKDYEPMLKKAKDNFLKTFDEPLKRLEIAMQNLSLGVSSENVEEQAQLAFKAVKEKVREAVEVYKTMSKAQGAKLIDQADAQRLATIEEDQYRMANQSYGTSASDRILGASRSRIFQAEAGQQQAVLSSGGRNFMSGVWGLASDFAGKRGTMRPDMYRQYQINQLQEMQYQMPNQRLEQQNSVIGLQQRQLQNKTWNWNLTSLDQFQSSMADQIVKSRAAAKRGPISANDRLEAAQKAYDLQAKQAGNEKKIIESALKRAQLDLPKIESDYATAMQAVTARLNEMLGDKGSGDGKGETGEPDGNGVVINISDIKAGITEADIDKWMPQIRTKLCALAKRDGSR